jgi:hypothetical protein
MKTIGGKILSIEIGVPVRKQDGGTYDGYQIVYNGMDGKVATLAKHMNSLKFQPALHEALKGLKAGDIFTGEIEKGDKGFWEVLSVRKETELPSEQAGRGESVASPKKEYKSDKSWETAEERAAKQRFIIRQSTLAQAVALVVAGKIEEKSVLKAAEKFEAWVMRQEPQPEVE